jgi:alpha-L-fucosidase
MGRWLKVNGEAIYGARSTPFGAELGAQVDGRFQEAKDWRCTSKPGKFYFTLFTWPAGLFQLPPMKAKATKAWLLSDTKSPLRLTTTDGKTMVSLPEKAPDNIASVIAVEIDGEP